MSYQSEAELEKQLVKQLESQGYNKVKISTEEELIKNFRDKLNKFNEKRLEGVPLTDKEFERVIREVEGKSIFESAKILRDKLPLDRDDGSQVYIEFFNSKSWCKNIFEVTTQTTVVGKYTNRYDVTLLVNGFPLLQIELKRRGVDFKEAFNQIQRYRKHSYQGLYRYIQVFVISNGVDTKYFSNSDRDILYTNTFFWTDKENGRITKLNEFADTFLERSFISKVIGRYMIINHTEKILMVMRPYQIYAVEAIINRALETNSNGYIWHTTGSGKTLTSFKASQILSNEPKIKKVFFLVDRKDLDSQTISEFNKFEKDSVDTTDKTSTLIKQIKDATNSLIVTTIQKMVNAIKSPRYSKILDEYKDEKVAFIIDECHRSQFGSMHTDIEKHFKKAQYFGFTGTPIFKENKSQDGRTTADLFHKMLHSYLIKDAIKDNNVLGFLVEYISTIRGAFDENDRTKVKSIDKKEVFMHDERITEIAEHIIENHNRKTKDKKYTAILAVESIEMLVKYYDKFKELNHDLKITGIFSYGANEESEGKDEHSRDSLERIIKDYNKMFDTKYSTDTFGGYFANVSKKVKSGQIDILIVVNMFLTGFDSKTLNTLYVDKNLVYHSLIQAYSRTNRVYKATKPYGNIVCYRNLKKKTDDAIKLFSKTDNADEVLMKGYNHYLEAFKEAVLNLYKVAKRPEDVDFIEGEKEKKEFIVAFRELSKLLIKLQTFVKFKFDEGELLISEQTYQDFKSKYLAIYDSLKNKEDRKESILDDVDFGIELMHTDKINVDYIMNLIRNIDLSNKEAREKDIKHVMEELDRADSEHLRLKVDLLKSFLQEVVPNLKEEDSVDDAYSKFQEVKRTVEIKAFAEEAAVKEEKLKDYISEYEYSGMLDRKDMSDNIEGTFLKRKKVLRTMTDFIKNHVAKFN